MEFFKLHMEITNEEDGMYHIKIIFDDSELNKNKNKI